MILNYFLNSGVAHSIKDLEKALPSVASINGMQVKDFLQALSDENQIHVEKIGSGNWYWAFLSEAKKEKEALLARATDERDKAKAATADMQVKVDEAGAAREEDEDMLLDPGADRKSMITRHAELAKELEPLKKELAGYSENDPVEVEKKRERTMTCKKNAETLTDQIQSMESYMKKLINDREQLMNLKRDWYGDQFDEEEQGIREL